MKRFITLERINKFIFLISFAAYTAAGVLILVKSSLLYKIAPLFFILIFALSALRSLLCILLKKDSHSSLIELGLNLVFAALVWLYPPVLKIFTSAVMGAWFLLMGLIRFFTAYQLKRSGACGTVKNISFGMLNFGGGLFLIISPLTGFDAVMLFIGVYLILYAVTNLFDFIDELMPYKENYETKQRVRITLPAVITAFTPGKFLRLFNKFEELDAQAVESVDDIVKKSGEDAEIEIFIHVSGTFPGIMGHVDICIGDTVFSYGNYDENSYYLFGMAGDGVMETVEKEKYLRFCIERVGKTVISYGLNLSKAQMLGVEKVLQNIFKETKPWEPVPANTARAALKKAKYMRDYAMNLYKDTNAKFYKFISGSKYKQYFGLNMNCARLAQDVLEAAGGIDLLKPDSVITPGLYYSYLNGEFLKKNSSVVFRKIYHRNNVKA